jgi:flagellar protein FliO/FliZ
MNAPRFLPAALTCAALTCFGAAAFAADQPAAASAGGLLQVLLGLVVVLGLMAGAAWLLKRLGVAKSAAGAPVRIVGGVSVSNREKIMVVEVGDQWIVVGVAPGRVSALSTMPRQEIAPAGDAAPITNNFSAWLKQTIEKRNGNN